MFAIACLIVLVSYLPQLSPQLPDDAVESHWHGTDEFVDDSRYASLVASRLWKRLCDIEDDFWRTTFIIEELVWSHIQKYQGGENAKPLLMTSVCICGRHIGDLHTGLKTRASEDEMTVDECLEQYRDMVAND